MPPAVKLAKVNKPSSPVWAKRSAAPVKCMVTPFIGFPFVSSTKPLMAGNAALTCSASANGLNESTVLQIVRAGKSRLVVRSTSTPPSLCSMDSLLKSVSVFAVEAGTVKQTLIGGATVAVVWIS